MTYSNEEVQHVLENLFLEKKKVKKLQQEIDFLHNERNSLILKIERLQQRQVESPPSIPSEDSIQIGQLKKNLQKKEYDLSKTQVKLLEAQRDIAFIKELREKERKEWDETHEDTKSLLEQIRKLKQMLVVKETEFVSIETVEEIKREKESLKEKLTESYLHAEQLEKGMAYLRNKMEESQLEASQLGEELAAAQDLLKQASENNEQAQEASQRLKQELLEGNQEKKEILEELNSLQNQFDQLKSKVIISQQQSDLLNRECDTAQKAIKELQAKEQQLESEKHRLEKELELKHQTLAEEMQKVQEFEKRCHSALQAKTSAAEENLQLRHHIEQLRYSSEQEKQHLLASKESRISSLLQDVQRLTEVIKGLQSQLEEREGQIKIAQQHLAKKVKDHTILCETAEAQRNQLNELRNNWGNAHAKITELRQALEVQQQQEQKLREILNENIKISESQIRESEEKYLKLYQKWVETDGLYKELKKVEEKHIQLQALFANLGNVLGTPVNTPSTPKISIPSNTPSMPLLPAEEYTPIPPPISSPTPPVAPPEKDLFSSPIRMPPKKNLFD